MTEVSRQATRSMLAIQPPVYGGPDTRSGTPDCRVKNANAQAILACAAELIDRADGILIGAGAGMGVDSGLPDFRGAEGLWRAYPVARTLGLDFRQLANPQLFTLAPRLAWGFYGHRFNLYRSCQPHDGYRILKRWCERKPAGGFIYTSNVDCQFQKAGFHDSTVAECHGSIHHWQCVDRCGEPIWQAPARGLQLDEGRMLLTEAVPRCGRCGAVARPNIAMFSDWKWDRERSDEQLELCQQWIAGIALEKLVLLEIGAGTAIPSVRNFSAGYPNRIRINPAWLSNDHQTVQLKMGACDALNLIETVLNTCGSENACIED